MSLFSANRFIIDEREYIERTIHLFTDQHRNVLRRIDLNEEDVRSIGYEIIVDLNGKPIIKTDKDLFFISFKNRLRDSIRKAARLKLNDIRHVAGSDWTTVERICEFFST